MIHSKTHNYAIVIRLLTMSIVWLMLLIWFLNAYRASCVAALAIFGLLVATILVGGTEKSYFFRRAVFNECLHKEGRLFHVVHNRILLTLREGLYAVVMASFLMAGAMLFEPRQWSLLFGVLMLLTLLLPRLAAAMGSEIRDEYRFAMARQWAMWISVLLLWGEATMVLIFSPPTDYAGMRWQEVVTYGVSNPDVLCPLFSSAAEVYAVGQALAIWSVQNAGRVLNDPTQAVMVWVGITTLFGFTFIVSLAYSRALIGVMARPWEMWSSFSTKESINDQPSTTGSTTSA